MQSVDDETGLVMTATQRPQIEHPTAHLSRGWLTAGHERSTSSDFW